MIVGGQLHVRGLEGSDLTHDMSAHGDVHICYYLSALHECGGFILFIGSV